MAFNPRRMQRKFGAGAAARRYAGKPPRQELPPPLRPTNDKGQPVIQQRTIAPPPLFSPRAIAQSTGQRFSGNPLF